MKPKKKIPAADFSENLHFQSPERSLWGAVLWRAIHDYFGKGQTARVAEDWLFRDDDVSPCSFPWVCQHLSLSHEALRKGLLCFSRRGDNFAMLFNPWSYRHKEG